MEEASDTTSDSTSESDNSRYVWVSWLPWAFPELALEFPEIHLGNPRVVVLDLFGVVLVCAFSEAVPLFSRGCRLMISLTPG